MRIGVFLTHDVSLDSWREAGLLDRELALYRALEEQGISTTFFSYGGREDLALQASIAPLNVVPLCGQGARPRWGPLRLLRPLSFLLTHRRQLRTMDLIKTNQMLGSWMAVLAKWLSGKPLILRCGFEYYRFLLEGRAPWHRRLVWRWLSASAYRAANVVVLTSETDRDFVRRVFKVPDAKLLLQPNYVDTERFKPLEASRFDTRALFIGRLEEQKNLLALLDAVHRAGCELDIIGEGSLRPRIERAIKEQGISARLLGRIPNRELPKIINRYPVYVLPSLYEGHPKTLLESMSCGLAVIGTKVPGIREIISDGRNGLLCDPDPASISQALSRAFSDDALRRRVGEQARADVLARCSLPQAVRLELACYRGVAP